MEPLYGSASPMWAAAPSAGFAFQSPTAVSNGPIAGPTFGPPVAANPIGGGSGMPHIATLSSLSTGTSGPTASPAGAYAYAAGLPVIAPAPVAGLTASSLLAAIAIRRGQPQGPANDQEVEDFIYDALDLLPGAADVEVRCENGRATLTGSVQHKRLKHDVGEIAWAIPALTDVQNNVTIAPRRRARASRESETPASGSARKQG
jgi:hypothetical protein